MSCRTHRSWCFKMAGRFLIVPKAVTHSDPAPESHPASLEMIFETPHFRLLADDGTPCVVTPDRLGLVIGHLFSRGDTPCLVTDITAREARDINISEGQCLIERYWGGYCYLKWDEHGMLKVLMRDPSGGMPCYWLMADGQLFAASDARLIAQSQLAPLSIDWRALHRHLYAYDLRAAPTCLHGVTELMPGERVLLRPAPQTASCWSPWDQVHPARRWSHQDLRQTVDACVQAWATTSTQILQTVSGGLDSSICTAALRHAPHAVTLMTMTTDEAEGDERRYARILAGAFDRFLIEARHEFRHIDLTQTLSAHLPRPVNYALGQSELPARRAAIEQYGCDTIFTGVGGDNVFCHMRSATAVVDRLRSGDLVGSISTVRDVCRMTDASILEVVRGAKARFGNPDPAYRWLTNDSYLTRTAAPQVSHPWLDTPAHALPGQSVHIAMLLRLQATTDGYDRALWPLQINPLTSQPIMEMCLGIPSWQWCEGGRDRSVARAAFDDLLPRVLVERRSKGGANSFAHQLITKNRDLLRQHLCDGLLANHGVIERFALEQVLDPRRDIPFTEHLRLLFLTEAESWARVWSP